MKATPHEFTNRDQQRREGNERQKETERRTQTTSKMTLKLEKRKKQEARNKVVNRVVRIFSLFLSHSSCVSRILFFQGKGDRTRETVSNACCTPCSFSLLLLSDDDLHVHVVVGEGRTSIPGERNTKISPEV